MDLLIWPDLDDVGYEFRREALLAAAEEPPNVLRLVPALPVPRNICAACGEFLPHACAPLVTITRARFTGRRRVVITDRPWHTLREAS